MFLSSRELVSGAVAWFGVLISTAIVILKSKRGRISSSGLRVWVPTERKLGAAALKKTYETPPAKHVAK
jgi:hypothetical protein